MKVKMVGNTITIDLTDDERVTLMRLGNSTRTATTTLVKRCLGLILR